MKTRFAGIDGKVAVVTGAARGVGRAIADALCDHGAHVAYIDIHHPDTLVRESGRALAVHCDVSDEHAVDAAVSTIEAWAGTPTILVNNAAIIVNATTEQTAPEQWRRILEVNVTGAFLMARRILPGMRQAGWGRIVNIGSNAGKDSGRSNVVAYATSKAALHNLARSIAKEQASHGITANVVAPAVIDTQMLKDIDATALAELIPVGRIGTPDDVAYAVLFFVSEDASYMTGEVMDVNGGYLID